MAEAFGMNHQEMLNWINENILLQQKNEFSIYNVFLKNLNKYIGYCGCSFLEQRGVPEIELLWSIDKKIAEFDLEIEIVFATRNAMFKDFNITSLGPVDIWLHNSPPTCRDLFAASRG